MPSADAELDDYLKLAVNTGAPPAVECSLASQRGRMKVDPAAGTLYICANAGWITK